MMKIQISQFDLLESLKIVSRAVSGANTLPVLGNILIKAEGKKVYRQKGKKLADTVKVPGWTRTAAEGKIFYSINRSHPLLTQVQEFLPLEKQNIFKDLIFMLESSFPTELFYSDAAKKPEALSKPAFDEEYFSGLLNAFISPMVDSNIPEDEIVERLLSIEPFASYSEEIEKLLQQKGLPHD